MIKTDDSQSLQKFLRSKKVLGERKNVRNETQQITELGLLQYRRDFKTSHVLNSSDFI